MKKSDLQLWLLAAGTVSWHLLFWNESWGINTGLFSIIILIFIILSKRDLSTTRNYPVAVAGLLAASLLVILYDTPAARLAWVMAFIVLLGFVTNPGMRSVLNCVPAAVHGLFSAPAQMLRQIGLFRRLHQKYGQLFRVGRLIILPGAVLMVFYVIFKIANPVFLRITFRIENYIFRFIEGIFTVTTLEWLVFMSFGLFLVMGVLFSRGSAFFTRWDQRGKDLIVRKRKVRGQFAFNKPRRGLAGLKNETLAGTILVVLLNILLLTVNIIDIQWLWFNFDYRPGMNLSQLVHEGTYLLIFSILLSISILLYFFRNNQNFYIKNTWLKAGAYAWLLQNVILGISVAVRNYHYIAQYGLAYKRIGVCFFLLLVFAGLLFTFIKIKNGKSAYYLLRMNSWSVYLTVLLLACINWDPLIAKVNLGLKQTENVDVSFLLSLSDKALPELISHAQALEKAYPVGEYNQIMEVRRNYFLQQRNSYTWLSWNYADYEVVKYLQAHPVQNTTK